MSVLIRVLRGDPRLKIIAFPFQNSFLCGARRLIIAPINLYHSLRMKLWVAKNSEVPVGEQLVAQLTLAIAAGDLGVGEKLPSTRAIAVRCGIHANTVSSVYRRLVEQGLVEFRRGSGFYVAESAGAHIEGSRRLDALIAELAESAKELGFEVAEVVGRVRRAMKLSVPSRPVLIESNTDLRDILLMEIAPVLPGIEALTVEEFGSGHCPADALVIAMRDEKQKIDPILAPGQKCIYLKGRSASASMSGERLPGPSDTVGVVSGWDDFLSFARIMLLAVKVEPGNLIVRSTADPGWKDAIDRAAMIICDALTSQHFDGRPGVRTFRVISDESIAELRLAIPPDQAS